MDTARLQIKIAELDRARWLGDWDEAERVRKELVAALSIPHKPAVASGPDDQAEKEDARNDAR